MERSKAITISRSAPREKGLFLQVIAPMLLIALSFPVLTVSGAQKRLRYCNTAVGFAFYYPVGWKPTPLPNNDGAVLTNPSHPGAAMKAWGFSLTSGTLEKEAGKTENLLRNDAADFALLKEKEMKIGADRALWRAYSLTKRNDSRKWRALGIYILHRNLVFVFLGTCPTDSWAKLAPVFEGMAKSFKVMNPRPEETDGGEP
jgi:predicted Zn-dependent protease